MPTIQERFEEFHTANPEVYDEIVAIVHQGIRAGLTRWSIGGIWEVVRWQRALDPQDDSDYRLNDHYRSRYARLVMELEPDLAGFFEIRDLRAA